jgi:DNA processing protein
MLQQISQAHRNYIALWYVLQHSLSSFYKLQKHFPNIADAIAPQAYGTWRQLGIHKNHLQRFREFYNEQAQQSFEHCLNSIQQHSDFIVCLEDTNYPQQLLPFVDRPPILFGQGNLDALNAAQIAVVGSRKPSPHGQQVAYDFAYYLADQGFYINSGLAQGIDHAAHRAALSFGRTIAVMATGLDQTYPSQHQTLRQEIVQEGGSIITEFLPYTPPLQHHFPRRNRIVSGLSLGVIVAEASLKSGSLITAKAAAEQGKTVFAIPGHIYSEHHQGCHHLIREGAILIDHPEQVLEDLALATTWQIQQQPNKNTDISEAETNLDIPSHLHSVYESLDWVGQSIDQLATHLNMNITELTIQLMELELLGMTRQEAGLYLRCRNNEFGSQ